MAITKSAKKAKRVSARRYVVNLRRKRALHDASVAVEKAAGADKAAAAKLLPAAYQAVDKAAKLGVIKPNTAARKKARLARLASAS